MWADSGEIDGSRMCRGHIEDGISRILMTQIRCAVAKRRGSKDPPNFPACLSQVYWVLGNENIIFYY